jgi:hypothetical protein
LRDEFAKEIVLVHISFETISKELQVINSAKIKEINAYIQSQIFDPTSFPPDYRNAYIHPKHYTKISYYAESGYHICYGLNLYKMASGALECILSLQVKKETSQRSEFKMNSDFSLSLVNVIYPNISSSSPLAVTPRVQKKLPSGQQTNHTVVAAPTSERLFGSPIYGLSLVGGLPYYGRR